MRRALAERGAAELGRRTPPPSRSLRVGRCRPSATRMIVAVDWSDAVLVAPGRARRCPASTCSSSTPATTSPRPSAPATRSTHVYDVTMRQRPAAADRRRAGRRVRRGPVRPRPRPVLRDAQGRAAASDALSAVRRVGHRHAPRGGADPRRHPGRRLGRQARAWSRSTRSPPGPTTTCDAYVAEHGVPGEPAASTTGYPSIGCAPCTAQPLPGEDPRAGRWAGHRQDRMRAAHVTHTRTPTAIDEPRDARCDDHLDALEAEAIHIFREVAGEFERPVMLFSGGKDSDRACCTWR